MSNNTNTFFDDLKKIFTASVIVTNKKGRQKVVNMYKINTNANLIKNFEYNNPTGVYTPSYYGFNNNNTFENLRTELYKDYELMDKDAILSTALDIYSDEASTRNVIGNIYEIRTENETIKNSLENLFSKILNIEFNLWSWIRNLIKYGDFFLKLDIVKDIGILNAHPLSVYAIDRIDESDKPDELYFAYNTSIGNKIPFNNNNNIKNDAILKLENYEVAHFRMLSDTNFLPYGKSILEPARKTWKQMVLMEESMLLQRIMRAPEKRVFKVEVGNIPPNEVETHINNVMNGIKKVPYIDEQTGEYNLKFGLMNSLEDFVVPVRGNNSGTDIDTLPSLEYSAIDDIEYLRLKLLSSLKIPKSFIGFDDMAGDRTSLSAQDIRFSKSVERIQRIVESELSKIAITHLYAQGIDESEIKNFDIVLTPSSQVAQMEHLETMDQMINVANSFKDLKMFSDDYIYENIFNLSDAEKEKEEKRIVDTYKKIYRLYTIENEGNDPFESEGKTNKDYELDKKYEETINKLNNTHVNDAIIKQLKNNLNKNKQKLLK